LQQFHLSGLRVNQEFGIRGALSVIVRDSFT
jgi:hypothetical protein